MKILALCVIFFLGFMVGIMTTYLIFGVPEHYKGDWLSVVVAVLCAAYLGRLIVKG